MVFIHSAVLVTFMRTLGAAGTERRGVTELTLGCHAHPPSRPQKKSAHTENAVEILRVVRGQNSLRMLKSPSSKAAASEEARRTLRYVEPLSEVRTPLADLFSILLGPNATLRQNLPPQRFQRMPSSRRIFDPHRLLELLFVMFKVCSTDNVLLNDRLERFVHGRLAEVIPYTEEL